MRESFRENLRRQQGGVDIRKEGEVHSETQEKIRELQQKKAEVMNVLRTRFRAIENGSTFQPDTEHIWNVRCVDGVFIAREHTGAETEITAGDIMTDFTWGVGYVLDPHSVPYNIQKQYAVALAKHRVLHLADEQILFHESEHGDEKSKKTFRILQERKEHDDWALGHVAERFIVNFLKKLSINLDVDFDIQEVDVFEDVVDKIDFVLRVKNWTRGVDIETQNGGKDVAVQITLKNTKDQVYLKHQIMHEAIFERGLQGDIQLDDAILLYIDEKYIRQAFGKWRHKRLTPTSISPPPGGPELLMNKRGQEELLHRLLANIYSPEAIQKLCEHIGVASGKPVTDWRGSAPSKKLLKKLHKKTS